MRFPPRVLAPSDVASADLPLGSTMLLGGRVVAVEGTMLALADAFAVVRCSLDSVPSALMPGDLAVVRAAAGPLPLRGALAEVHKVPDARRAFAAGSETSRGAARGLVARARACAAIRAYFEAAAFIEVDTPCMVPSPGLDLHLDAFEVSRGPRGRARWLSTSPEYQMKRLLVRGIPRCFQLAHCFRDGERGAIHEPEFTMLEWYRAFSTMDEVLAETEVIVRAVADALGARELSFRGRTSSLEGPFERARVLDAFTEFTGAAPADVLSMSERDPNEFFRLLVEHIEPGLAARGRPVFLTHWPAAFASLARRAPDDARVAERFELYACGVELCNGFGELVDPTEQRARFEADQRERAAIGKPVYPVDERFLDALSEGMPPAAGNALGLERLVALCAVSDSLREVVAFPDEDL